MDDFFKIYVDRLRDGYEQELNETFSPDFLDIDEPDLTFKEEVQTKGKAYLAEQELLIQWEEISTSAIIPCSICNERVKVPIHIHHFYHAEPMNEIKSGIFNYKELLRETILLEIPPFFECNQGNCPKRKEISKYLKSTSEDQEDDEGYHPFADLDWKE